jgi:hypothetical protein
MERNFLTQISAAERSRKKGAMRQTDAASGFPVDLLSFEQHMTEIIS